MTELSDLDIDREHRGDEPELEFGPDAAMIAEPEPPRPGSGLLPWVSAVLILIAGAFGWWYWGRPSPPAEEPVPPMPAVTAPAEPPPPASTVEEPLELPPLAASDAAVARLVGALSAHPQLARWLAHEALVERFVAAVDNVADGKSPRAHVDFAQPQGDFEVVHRDDAIYLDPASYERYDTAAAVIASLDVEGTAKLVRQLEPLFDESYAQLGYANRRFRNRLLAAIDALLAVPVIEQPPELREKVRSYELADPQLEALSPAQKHLLRMGPINARAVQAKLRAIRARLTAEAEVSK
jgi:hypothetical protein